MRRAALIALLSAAQSAHGSTFLTGQRLYEMLIDQDPFLRAQASGYIAGITDTNNGLGPTNLKWCFDVPNGVATRQVLAIVTKFVEQQKPVKRALGAPSLVEEALSKAYPCKK